MEVLGKDVPRSTEAADSSDYQHTQTIVSASSNITPVTNAATATNCGHNNITSATDVNLNSSILDLSNTDNAPFKMPSNDVPGANNAPPSACRNNYSHADSIVVEAGSNDYIHDASNNNLVHDSNIASVSTQNDTLDITDNTNGADVAAPAAAVEEQIIRRSSHCHRSSHSNMWVSPQMRVPTGASGEF